MTVSEIIRPGDKIDIKLLQQLEHQEKTGEQAKLYKSQVLDINKNGSIEIAMPTEAGRLILLPLGVRFEFVFYSKGLLYRSVGQIKERYKKDNMYMLEIELNSQLEKFQRREFYRYACTMDTRIYELTEEQAELDSVEKIFLEIRDEHFREKEKKAIIVDISGGGSKIHSPHEWNAGENLLIELHLVNEKMNKQYYIVGNVIDCYRMEQTSERIFECRVKFIIKDNKVREEIIRYIFEEERRTRQKVNG